MDYPPLILLDKNGRELRVGDTLRTKMAMSGMEVTGTAELISGRWFIRVRGIPINIFDISNSEILEGPEQ